MKCKILLLLFFFYVVLSACSHIKENNTSTNTARWAMYKSFFRHEQEIATIGQCAYKFRNGADPLLVYSPLILDLVIDSTVNQGDTIVFSFRYYYAKKEVIPTCADYPTGVGLYNNKIVFYLQDKRKSHHLFTEDSLFCDYLKDHRSSLNPWLRQEAQRRGIIK